jgi:hypothetical protein
MRLRYPRCAARVWVAALWCAQGLALAPADAAERVVTPEETPLPTISTPLPQTSASHAFNAALHQQVPLDLERLRYLEEEYLMSGEARVYDWPALHTLTTRTQAHYVTRILVRRPSDPKRFSGTVIVEPLNPSTNVDLPIMWAESHEYFIEAGDVWVGVTIKPNTVDSLKRFDPSRYGSLTFTTVQPFTAQCKAAEAEYLADIHLNVPPPTPTGETGLAWDILSQLGALLKSGTSRNPLHDLAIRRLYMTGQSQTAGYMRTYANAIASIARLAHGKRIYDAYLGSGHMPWQVPLHNCAAPLAAGDPRLVTLPLGVPIMEFSAQSDILSNASTRRPDSDAAPDLFRRYEVAGGSHVDTWEVRSFPAAEDLVRSGAGAQLNTTAACVPPQPGLSDFPIRFYFNGGWRNLEQWVRSSSAPPRAELIHLNAASTPEQRIAVDDNGNAIGGVRSPELDVPTARWEGTRGGPGGCMLLGYSVAFDAAKLNRLYRNHEAYLAKVTKDVEQLRQQGWLTAKDARAIAATARTAQIP